MRNLINAVLAIALVALSGGAWASNDILASSSTISKIEWSSYGNRLGLSGSVLLTTRSRPSHPIRIKASGQNPKSTSLDLIGLGGASVSSPFATSRPIWGADGVHRAHLHEWSWSLSIPKGALGGMDEVRVSVEYGDHQMIDLIDVPRRAEIPTEEDDGGASAAVEEEPASWVVVDISDCTTHTGRNHCVIWAKVEGPDPSERFVGMVQVSGDASLHSSTDVIARKYVFASSGSTSIDVWRNGDTGLARLSLRHNDIGGGEKSFVSLLWSPPLPDKSETFAGIMGEVRGDEGGGNEVSAAADPTETLTVQVGGTNSIVITGKGSGVGRGSLDWKRYGFNSVLDMGGAIGGELFRGFDIRAATITPITPTSFRLTVTAGDAAVPDEDLSSDASHWFRALHIKDPFVAVKLVVERKPVAVVGAINVSPEKPKADGFAYVEVSLSTKPKTPVSIKIEGTGATPNKTTLTFTPTDFATAQAVRVEPNATPSGVSGASAGASIKLTSETAGYVAPTKTIAISVVGEGGGLPNCSEVGEDVECIYALHTTSSINHASIKGLIKEGRVFTNHGDLARVIGTPRYQSKIVFRCDGEDGCSHAEPAFDDMPDNFYKFGVRCPGVNLIEIGVAETIPKGRELSAIVRNRPAHYDARPVSCYGLSNAPFTLTTLTVRVPEDKTDEEASGFRDPASERIGEGEGGVGGTIN